MKKMVSLKDFVNWLTDNKLVTGIITVTASLIITAIIYTGNFLVIPLFIIVSVFCVFILRYLGVI